MTRVINVSNLTKRFGDKTALNQVSFHVDKGEVFGLLGHNGAGKSTTIDCCLGLKKPEEGMVTILGQNPKKNRTKLFEHVGVQLQSTSYQNNIRVEEVLEEMSALYNDPADYKLLLKEFDLQEVIHQKVETLSGGERQKLSVLLTLLPKPEVIFLDELTTGLDPVARREVWRILKRLNQKGVTILLTSHYMDEVEYLCDYAVILKEGEIITQGTIKELIAESPYGHMEEAYLWYMGEEVM